MDISKSGSGTNTEVRFRNVPIQRRFRCRYPCQVPESSGTKIRKDYGGFRYKYLEEVSEDSGANAKVRFRKIPVQRLGENPEGSGVYTQVR